MGCPWLKILVPPPAPELKLRNPPPAGAPALGCEEKPIGFTAVPFALAPAPKLLPKAAFGASAGLLALRLTYPKDAG